MKYLLILINLVLVVFGNCPNMCSGHGTCKNGVICDCYPGWREGDCSGRIFIFI